MSHPSSQSLQSSILSILWTFPFFFNTAFVQNGTIAQQLHEATSHHSCVILRLSRSRISIVLDCGEVENEISWAWENEVWSADIWPAQQPQPVGESKLKSAKGATFKCTGPRKGKVWRVHMFHGKEVRSCDCSTKQAAATNVTKAVLWPTYAGKGTLSCEILVAGRRGS